MESLIMDQYTRLLLGFHQQMWLWTDFWFDLTFEEVQLLEENTKKQLEDQIKSKEKRGSDIR